MSSATVYVRCFSIRHFAAAVLIAHGSALRWYHASSWALSWGVSLIAARFVLNFFATLVILCMSSFVFRTSFLLVGAV